MLNHLPHIVPSHVRRRLGRLGSFEGGTCEGRDCKCRAVSGLGQLAGIERDSPEDQFTKTRGGPKKIGEISDWQFLSHGIAVDGFNWF